MYILVRKTDGYIGIDMEDEVIRDKIKIFANGIRHHRKSLIVFALFIMLAVTLRMRDLRQVETFQGVVERDPASGSTKNQIFQFHLEEKKDTNDPDSQKTAGEQIGENELSLEVSPLQLEQEEAFKLLEIAQGEWEGAYLGDNTSAEEVRQDLVFPTSLCNGMVSIDYESSNYEVLGTDGIIQTDSLSAEGELVELTVRFSYGDFMRIDTCNLLILPPKEGSEEWILRELKKEAAQAEEESRQQKAFALPDAVGEYQVIWERGESSVWIFFLLLGGIAVFCLEMRGRQEEKEGRKKRMERLEFEYPQMVDQFAVLLESGMTIRKAWERILVRGHRSNQTRKKRTQDSDIYLEEMWITYREIREGRGEREAYERFGSRIGLMPYKRFCSILTQNLSKGTRNVKELLERESKEALEMRKSRARKMGEEAGTKMLFPMLVMLMLILLILLMPALTNL